MVDREIASKCLYADEYRVLELIDKRFYPQYANGRGWKHVMDGWNDEYFFSSVREAFEFLSVMHNGTAIYKWHSK